MYLIPKAPQVDQKDGSSYSKIIKTINKSIGRFRRDIALRWDKKKKKTKWAKGSSCIFTKYKKVCAELQVKVLIKKQEFKEELRNL